MNIEAINVPQIKPGWKPRTKFATLLAIVATVLILQSVFRVSAYAYSQVVSDPPVETASFICPESGH
jgi:hypothetical protein